MQYEMDKRRGRSGHWRLCMLLCGGVIFLYMLLGMHDARFRSKTTAHQLKSITQTLHTVAEKLDMSTESNADWLKTLRLVIDDKSLSNNKLVLQYIETHPKQWKAVELPTRVKRELRKQLLKATDRAARNTVVKPGDSLHTVLSIVAEGLDIPQKQVTRIATKWTAKLRAVGVMNRQGLVRLIQKTELWRKLEMPSFVKSEIARVLSIQPSSPSRKKPSRPRSSSQHQDEAEVEGDDDEDDDDEDDDDEDDDDEREEQTVPSKPKRSTKSKTQKKTLTGKDSIESAFPIKGVDNPPIHLVIDGVIFGLQGNGGGGISRVWMQLVPELVKVLDPAHTKNKITLISHHPSVKFDSPVVTVGSGDIRSIVASQAPHVVFISTYYTFAEGACNVLFVHDCIPERVGMAHGPGSEYWPRIENTKKANSFITVSHSTTKDMMDLYDIPERLITTSWNRVDSMFKPASKEAIDKFKKDRGITKPFFLICGQRWDYKQPWKLLEALQLGSPSLKDKVQVVFMGGGGSFSGNENAHKNGIDAVFLGHIDRKLMPVVFSAAAAYVTASKYEGFGMPVAEAMACGTPVIVNDNSALKEVAGDAGLRVNANDAKELHKALVKVLKPKVAKEMSRKGLKYSRLFGGDGAKEHDWNEVARDWVRHIRYTKHRGKECSAFTEAATGKDELPRGMQRKLDAISH